MNLLIEGDKEYEEDEKGQEGGLGDEPNSSKCKAVIEVCFNSKTARFNVNDPTLKGNFSFVDLAFKASEFFSLPAE